MIPYDRQDTYLKMHDTLLAELKAMWEDPRVQLYNDAELPSDIGGSVFLKGPTSRHQVLECQWRARAVRHLRAHGFTGWIFCPEPRGLELATDFTERSYIHWWESKRLMKATYKAAWIPRRADELLGLNTNFEVAMFVGMVIAGAHVERNDITFDACRLFIGWPKDAERMGLPNHYVTEWAHMKPYHDLEEMCKAIAVS